MTILNILNWTTIMNAQAVLVRLLALGRLRADGAASASAW